MSGLHDVAFHGAEMPLRHAMADIDVNRYLASLLENGARAGAWQVEDPSWVAVIIYYSVHGACDDVLTGAQPGAEVADKLSTLFRRRFG